MRTPTGTISSSPPAASLNDPGQVDGEKKDKTPGPLWHANKERAAKAAYKLWSSRDQDMERRLARWEVNSYRREGVSEARLMKEQDRWISWVPRWVESDPERNPVPNKTARLARRLESHMFADPPAAQAIPSTGEDDDIHAAETSTRILADLDGEHALDEVGNYRQAFAMASTHDSGFVWYYVNPKGGGRNPKQIEAGFDEGTPGDPMQGIPPRAPREAQDITEAEIDPQTGTGWPDTHTRYVREDGTLTEDIKEAALEWLPMIEAEILTGRNVRMIPHTARDISKARGVQIATYRTWGELKEMFPKLASLEEEKQEHLFRFRPKDETTRDAILDISEADQGALRHRREAAERDEQRILCLTTYYKASAEYPDGLYMISLADSYVAYRDGWVLELDDAVPEPLELPLAQVKQFQEGTNDPYGRGIVGLMAAGADARALQLASFFDYLDQLQNLKTFLPSTGTTTAADMESDSRYLNTLPGTEPKKEALPAYPNMAVELFQIMSDEMDQDSGLGQLAQGLDSPNVESGRQAYAVISQAHAGLSEPRQNVTKAFVRGGRIKLQLVRAFFGSEQKLRWLGKDNRYKVQAWSVSDIRSTRDVQLAPGTMSMMTPAQKAALLEHWAMSFPEAFPQVEVREAMAKTLGGTLALQDNPVTMRVRGQLARWADGPPTAWVPTAEGEIDPAWKMFEPVPSDVDPTIAPIRAREIADFMQGSEYHEQPAAWRAVVDAEYERMRAPAPTAAPVPMPGGPPPGMGMGMPLPQPFGIAPPDMVPPEVAGALPPEAAPLPMDPGALPPEVTAV